RRSRRVRYCKTPTRRCAPSRRRRSARCARRWGGCRWPFREPLVLAHVAGFSYKEIAEILTIPPGTVMSRLFRARRLLRSELREPDAAHREHAMTCEEMPRVIDAYLDGELSVAATLRAHEHFAACETCRRIPEAEAALRGLLVRGSRAERVPADLRSNVLCALPAGEPGRIHPARRLAIRFGVVSGFIGLAVLGWLATERLAPY